MNQNNSTLQATKAFQESEHSLVEYYRRIAQHEDAELILHEDVFPMAEFKVALTSAVVLRLVDARKRYGTTEPRDMSLSDVIERILQD